MSKKYCNSNIINLTQNVEENEILHEIFRLVSLFFPDKFRVMENQLAWDRAELVHVCIGLGTIMLYQRPGCSVCRNGAKILPRTGSE